jgi:hypothetical protein
VAFPREVLLARDTLAADKALKLLMRHHEVIVGELLIPLLDREVGQMTVLIS